MGSNIFVQSDRVANSGRKNKKRLMLITGLMLLIIILGLVLWNTEQGRNLLSRLGIPLSQNGSNNKDEETQPTNMLNYKASQMIVDGDTAGATQLYKTEIDGTSSKDKKAELYLEIANLLWNNGETSESIKQQVLEFAKQSEQLHPTAQSAAFLWQIYLKIGNSTEAEKYLKLRDERGSDQPDSGGGR